MSKPICGPFKCQAGTRTGKTKAMESASKASKNVATPMMIRALTCHNEIGRRSIRATTSSMAPSPPAMLPVALIVCSPPLPRTRCPPAMAEGAARSNKLYGNAAELAKVGMQRIAFPGKHHARERGGENDMADIERHAVLAELVGEPRHAERGMAEHAGGDAGLLDLRVAIHDAADPAQVDLQRPDRPAADNDARRGAVGRHGVEYFSRGF